MYGNSNIDGVVAAIERDLNEAKRRYDRARFGSKAILESVRTAGRNNLTADETSKFDLFNAEGASARADVGDLEAKLARATAIAAEESEADALSQQRHSTSAPSTTNRAASVHVGAEARTYRAPAERNKSLPYGQSEPGFLTDLYNAQIRHDPSAMGRLERHGMEMVVERPELFEQRATGTTVIPGFIPPQYIAADFAVFARAGRPTANLCSYQPLPAEGMEVDLPRVTTPTATGVQTTENSALANQDVATTLLTNPVVSIGGYVVLSRQAVERGRLTEPVVMADLAADYNAKLDTQVLSGSGSSGQHRGFLNVAGINAVTFTQASPTIQLLWPKLASAVGQVVSGRFTGPTAIVMSPTCWVWMLSSVDSQGRPFIAPESVALNPLATEGGIDYSSPAGNLFGTQVYLDGNMPSNLGVGSNQTAILVADFRDSYLFEDAGGAPTQMVFEAPSAQNLGVLLVAYGYTAAALGRQPKAISVVQGTGLIIPAL